MNGDETPSLPLSLSLSLFMGLVSVLKDVKKVDCHGGRGRGGWVGHLRHFCASGLVDFMAMGPSKLH